MNDPKDVIEQTLKLLQDRPSRISLKDISKATGLKRGWLSMFHQGKITNPSFLTLQTLRNYLISIKNQADL